MDNLTNSCIMLDLKEDFGSAERMIFSKKLRSCDPSFFWYLVVIYSAYLNNAGNDRKLSDTCGVARGSVWGSMLFLIFATDLPNIYDKAKVTICWWSKNCGTHQCWWYHYLWKRPWSSSKQRWSKTRYCSILTKATVYNLEIKLLLSSWRYVQLHARII